MPVGIDQGDGDGAFDQNSAYHHALGADGREALPPQDERRKQEAYRGEARKHYAYPRPPSASASPPSSHRSHHQHRPLPTAVPRTTAYQSFARLILFSRLSQI